MLCIIACGFAGLDNNDVNVNNYNCINDILSLF